MKRSAFIIVTFLFIVLAAKGQSIEEIQTSKDYIWGTGNAATLKKADNPKREGGKRTAQGYTRQRTYP